MAFAAETEAVPRLAWLLWLSVVVWAVIYDTMYAMADREDDLRIGMQSPPPSCSAPRIIFISLPAAGGVQAVQSPRLTADSGPIVPVDRRCRPSTHASRRLRDSESPPSHQFLALHTRPAQRGPTGPHPATRLAS